MINADTTVNLYTLAVALITGVLASSGFWAFLTRRDEKRNLRNDLLIGLAHDRIIYLGMAYIRRGWISQDEYENLHDYLYTPYLSMGGNGSARKIMCEVEKLPIRTLSPYSTTEGDCANDLQR